ncbi:MAG TPA: DUF3883 domain-containing protein [Novosphingobium sp.]|nr:DUF3883 domain-containing protein [Novosphingobium sp.]
MDLIRDGIEDRATLTETLHLAAAVARNRTHNTIEMLREIGAIAVTDDGRCTTSIGPAEPATYIRKLLVDFYLRLLDDLPSISLFQLDHDGCGLKVSATQLPGRGACYPYALLEFDIFKRQEVGDSFWTVAEDLIPRFMTWLSRTNLSTPERLFSLADLKAANLAREAAGRVAEDWALAWERSRLASHPFLESVRSISDDNAGAGFDIISFDGPRALSHDRFIEVKGYADEFSFFWSSNEIEAARSLRMRYWLYLIDRRRISAPGYQPELIQDPVSYFLDRDPIGWSVSAQGLKFTRAAM